MMTSRGNDPGVTGPEPRIVWVNIINRPMIKNHPDKNRTRVLAGRSKFNEVLNYLIAETRFNHLLSIKGLTEVNSFTSLGDLSANGQYTYWKELDHIMKKFDRHEVNLKPNPQGSGDARAAQK